MPLIRCTRKLLRGKKKEFDTDFCILSYLGNGVTEFGRGGVSHPDDYPAATGTPRLVLVLRPWILDAALKCIESRSYS